MGCGTSSGSLSDPPLSGGSGELAAVELRGEDVTQPAPEPEPAAPQRGLQTSSLQPEMEKLLHARETWAKNNAALQAWLNSTQEEALEPELEIVDPHHHAWDMRELEGFNLFGLFKQQYYMSDQLLDDMVGGGHNVTHSVYAEAHSFVDADTHDPAMAPLGEVVAMQGLAAQFASGKYGKLRAVAGIIGTADLAKFGAEVEPLLVACKAAAPNFRGIRVNGQHDPGIKFGVSAPGLYRQTKFREGFALLAKHGLTFDAFLYSAQLEDLHDLATTFPETTIILNHNGCPAGALDSTNDTANALVDAWKIQMEKIAADCPNVYVKVGGGGMPQLGHGFDQRDKPPTSDEVAQLFSPLYMWSVETFGPGRCMVRTIPFMLALCSTTLRSHISPHKNL